MVLLQRIFKYIVVLQVCLAYSVLYAQSKNDGKEQNDSAAVQVIDSIGYRKNAIGMYVFSSSGNDINVSLLDSNVKLIEYLNYDQRAMSVYKSGNHWLDVGSISFTIGEVMLAEELIRFAITKKVKPVVLGSALTLCFAITYPINRYGISKVAESVKMFNSSARDVRVNNDDIPPPNPSPASE